MSYKRHKGHHSQPTSPESWSQTSNWRFPHTMENRPPNSHDRLLHCDGRTRFNNGEGDAGYCHLFVENLAGGSQLVFLVGSQHHQAVLQRTQRISILEKKKWLHCEFLSAVQTWALSTNPMNLVNFPLQSIFANIDYLFWWISSQAEDHMLSWIFSIFGKVEIIWSLIA